MQWDLVGLLRQTWTLTQLFTIEATCSHLVHWGINEAKKGMKSHSWSSGSIGAISQKIQSPLLLKKNSVLAWIPLLEFHLKTRPWEGLGLCKIEALLRCALVLLCSLWGFIIFWVCKTFSQNVTLFYDASSNFVFYPPFLLAKAWDANSAFVSRGQPWDLSGAVGFNLWRIKNK